MEPNQNAEKLTQLADKLDQIKKGGIPDLAAAYVKAWGEIDNVVKNAANPHFGSNYADLGAVLDTIRPIFKANDLALLMAPGAMEGDQMTLTWTLIHKSGQSIQGKMSLPIGSKATAQAGGSCLTYMRRYLSAAIGGIAQVDDDGNAASASPSERAPRKAAKGPVSTDSPSYAATRDSLIERVNASADLSSLEALREEIKALGDQAVADAYGAKKRELKGKK